MYATLRMRESDVKTMRLRQRTDRARARAHPRSRARRQAERERRLPKETIADMQAAGLFRVLQPRRWGGYEMDMATYWEVQLALGEGYMSTAWVYGVVGLHPWLMGLYRRPRRAGCVGQGRHHAHLLLADAGGHGDACAGRLPAQRPLEVLQRLRALRLGVSRRELVD